MFLERRVNEHLKIKVTWFGPPDLPDEKPRISGVQGSYQMHEDVIVNCSSPRSLPPATLTFYVNDEQVRHHVTLPFLGAGRRKTDVISYLFDAIGH